MSIRSSGGSLKASQPQLPRSGPTGQPIESSQLGRTLLPEYPDITLYIEHLRSRISSEPLEEVRFASPFFLRSVDVPIGAMKGKRVVELRRLGKRIVFALEDDLFLVLHLMIAGRLRW